MPHFGAMMASLSYIITARIKQVAMCLHGKEVDFSLDAFLFPSGMPQKNFAGQNPNLSRNSTSLRMLAVYQFLWFQKAHSFVLLTGLKTGPVKIALYQKAAQLVLIISPPLSHFPGLT